MRRRCVCTFHWVFVHRHHENHELVVGGVVAVDKVGLRVVAADDKMMALLDVLPDQYSPAVDKPAAGSVDYAIDSH